MKSFSDAPYRFRFCRIDYESAEQLVRLRDLSESRIYTMAQSRPYQAQSATASLIPFALTRHELMPTFCMAHDVAPDIEMKYIYQIPERCDGIVSGDVRYRYPVDNATLWSDVA